MLSSFSAISRAKVASSSSRAILSAIGNRRASALFTGSYETLNALDAQSDTLSIPAIPPIFDIFDAPARLGECSKQMVEAFQEENLRSDTKSRKKNLQAASISTTLPSVPPPCALPLPIMFDGPSLPTHLPLDTDLDEEEWKKMRALALSSIGAERHSSKLHFDRPSLSMPVIEVFDGPSRMPDSQWAPNARSSRKTPPSYLLLFGALSMSALVAIQQQYSHTFAHEE